MKPNLDGTAFFFATNCITGIKEKVTLFKENWGEESAPDNLIDEPLYVGPGLIDLQINGINGIDFNAPSLTPQEVLAACKYLLSKGITGFLPTVITNSDENILRIVQTIREACEQHSLVNDCVWGIHLEGPFLSPQEGARGAHDAQWIQPPDWELFQRFQEASGNKIKLVTIAPEWDEACSFIEKCASHGILIAIGHSMANTDQVKAAVNAGASLSTHLGNGVPLLLPRHPNIIWDQLAEENLNACLITDGVHLPDSFIKSVLKIKGDKVIIVSDATSFSGMPPGEYQSHIGGNVILDDQKRLSVKGASGILAGAATCLLDNVELLVEHQLATLSEAWKLASLNVEEIILKVDPEFKNNKDLVVFKMKGTSIDILKVIKNGKLFFEK